MIDDQRVFFVQAEVHIKGGSSLVNFKPEVPPLTGVKGFAQWRIVDFGRNR